MTQKEKSLLLQDLSARLPYGVKIDYPLVIDNPLLEDIVSGIFLDIRSVDIDHVIAYMPDKKYEIDLSKVRPYLRPMSSMTEEEKEQLAIIKSEDFQLVRQWVKNESFKETGVPCPVTCGEIDYCNKKHFDYRGLIEKSLALEAPEGMYDLNNK
jgi:hypothetical protein